MRNGYDDDKFDMIIQDTIKRTHIQSNNKKKYYNVGILYANQPYYFNFR